ncbi:DUF2334 domain-containing protein [Nocardioides sp. DS6]|uniref:DUF2334 domain-containing protein n=1 Tax=Nocardioides eburneus TaxID=3231482 RepID=A0ABV3SV71_9ACTN
MPQVLIKADDLRVGALSPRWRAFLEFCAEKGIHANVGIMGGWTQKGGDDDHPKPAEAKEMLSWLLAQPTLHIWNHGFTHLGDRDAGTSEFKGASAEAQALAIRKTQDRVEALCGARMNAFGAPFNWTDHNTVVALQQFPEITYSFYTPYVPGKVNLHHELFVTCEPFAGESKPGAPRRFALEQALARSQHFRDVGRSFVLQVHPNRWVEGSLQDFATFLETLTAQGYAAGTIESFAEQDLFAGPQTRARPLPHRMAGRNQTNAASAGAATNPPARTSTPQVTAAAVETPSARPHWTQKVPTSLRRAVPEAWRKRLRGTR